MDGLGRRLEQHGMLNPCWRAADCIQLAMQIDHLLYKPADVASDDPNIGAPG
jgi:hypothetical protein